MDNEHPTYPNPTITEAICDIRFQLPQGKEWKPSLPGEFFKHIQNEYPEMEPVAEVGLQFEFGAFGAGAKLIPPRQKVRFKHRTRSLIIQLAEDSLSVNTLSPYQGWEMMSQDILAAWQHVKEVLQPETINRIGLRYINKIKKETEQDHPGVWFTQNEYLSNSFLRSKPGFLLRQEIHLTAEDILIITLGDLKLSNEAGYGAIILDIDRIIEREMSTEKDVLEQKMADLHNDVWRVFSSAKSEKLETLLRRQQ